MRGRLSAWLRRRELARQKVVVRQGTQSENVRNIVLVQRDRLAERAGYSR